MKKPSENKIFIMVNSPLFIIQHLLPIINKLKQNNKVYLLYKEDNNFKIKINNIKTILIPINREPSLQDLLSLAKLGLLRFFLKPNICISFTPKAGLLNALTCFSYGKTYHYFTGQRWVNFNGIKLNFYKFIDKIIIKYCDKTFCDSDSQAEFVSKQLQTFKPYVIGRGSISGVNLKKYNVEKSYAKERLIRTKNIFNDKIKNLLLKKDTLNKTIFGFVGRLHVDKGINELINAFELHNKEFKNSYLLLIGPNELDQKLYKKIKDLNNCFHIKFINEIYIIMPCLSCLVLPSHREGFGSVILEAAASKTPIITTDIPGPRDFIKHLYNGYLVKPKDIYDLKESFDYLVLNSKNSQKFAKNAFDLCNKYYTEEYVCNLFVDELNN